MAITRLGFTGTQAAYSPFADKAESAAPVTNHAITGISGLLFPDEDYRWPTALVMLFLLGTAALTL